MPFELGLNCRVSFPKTQTMSAYWGLGPVCPRACGRTSITARPAPKLAGLSPRVRKNLTQIDVSATQTTYRSVGMPAQFVPPVEP